MEEEVPCRTFLRAVAQEKQHCRLVRRGLVPRRPDRF